MSRKPKDKNAPKKPMCAFMLFSPERRPAIYAETKEANPQISKRLASEWKSKTDDAKEVYERHAQELRKQYTEAVAAYRQTQCFKQYQRTLKQWKTERKEVTRRRRRELKEIEKPQRPERLPKRPPNAYFLFTKERRGTLRSLNPLMSNKKLNKTLVQEWRQKTETGRQFYKNRAHATREVWEQKMRRYRRKEEYRSYRARRAKYKKQREGVSLTQLKIHDCFQEILEAGRKHLTRIVMPRKPKDPRRPKRPLTAFFLFAREVRPRLRREHSKEKMCQISKRISQLWRNLPENEKEPYQFQSKDLSDQYKVQIENYQKTDAYKAYQQRLQNWKQECVRRREIALKRSRTNAKKKVQKPVQSTHGSESEVVNDVSEEESEEGDSRSSFDSEEDSDEDSPEDISDENSERSD